MAKVGLPLGSTGAVKTRVEEPRKLRTSWQKFSTLIPQNIRTC